MLFADTQFAVSTSAATTDAHNIAERFIISSLAFTPFDCSPFGVAYQQLRPRIAATIQTDHYPLLGSGSV